MRKDKKSPRVIVLRTAGTNCDAETAFAFRYWKARVDLIHINRLLSGEVQLKEYEILAIPGGFTYGDDIAAGRILANELRLNLGQDICQFLMDGKLIIGICNGFQVLVKAGILPGPLSEEEVKNHDAQQKVTLTDNDSGKFEDRWVHLRGDGRCVWTEGLEEIIYLPVAHGEGKFITRDQTVLQKLTQNGQVIFRYSGPQGESPDYPDNPNGSIDHIAGITDSTGRVLGLMPHPERHFLFIQHPHWTRLKNNGALGQGAMIFENGVKYAREQLL